ncbi:MAG: non-canonical purine NTP pyrophosphatase [Firmicutes bacterium]|nr:non-canonical purine NTP pyrophosphatase [Bacillota bacterium]MCL1954019.1 non-canonical purine NTP pyrophosphatase [Bacillota bacterium]
MKFVLATTNKGKLKQLSALLNTDTIQLCTLSDIDYTKEVIEDSGTFEGNSWLKANQIYRDTGMPTIADDSGLIIRVLDGRPGVDTAHYAGGEKFSRFDRLTALLKEMEDKIDRRASFVSYITCIIADETVIKVQGEMSGKISTHIVDLDKGMTFEPIFVPDGYDKCMSQLDEKDKLNINHRAKAVKKLLNEFKKIGLVDL